MPGERERRPEQEKGETRRETSDDEGHVDSGSVARRSRTKAHRKQGPRAQEQPGRRDTLRIQTRRSASRRVGLNTWRIPATRSESVAGGDDEESLKGSGVDARLKAAAGRSERIVINICSYAKAVRKGKEEERGEEISCAW